MSILYRFLADETDEQLVDHLRRQQPPVGWEAAERIMVAVSAAPGDEALIRRAARIAARVRVRLDVLHVVAGDGSRRGDGQSIDRLRELSGEVGGRWFEASDDDAVTAITAFARQHQITQIVIGSSRRSRWQQLTSGGSNVTRLIREAGAFGIDVHVSARPAPPSADSPAADAGKRGDPPAR